MKRIRNTRAFTALVVGLAVFSLSALGASVSTTTMKTFEGGSPIPGSSSTLVRNDAGATATIVTTDLDPGAAYTFWWVVFNNPASCSAPGCGEDDLLPAGGDIAVQSSVLYGGGHVVSMTGKGGFAGHLGVGDTTGALFGPGLLFPMDAEIHLITRTHEQPVSGMVEAQTSSFNGGCPPNTCRNDQAAVHPPIADEASMKLSVIETKLDTIEGTVNAIKVLDERIAASHSIKP